MYITWVFSALQISFYQHNIVVIIQTQLQNYNDNNVAKGGEYKAHNTEVCQLYILQWWLGAGGLLRLRATCTVPALIRLRAFFREVHTRLTVNVICLIQIL